MFRVQAKTLLNIPTFPFGAKFKPNQYSPFQQIYVNQTLNKHYMHKVSRMIFVYTDHLLCLGIKLSHNTTYKLSYLSGSKLTKGTLKIWNYLFVFIFVTSSILLKALFWKVCGVIKITLSYCLQNLLTKNRIVSSFYNTLFVCYILVVPCD